MGAEKNPRQNQDKPGIWFPLLVMLGLMVLFVLACGLWGFFGGTVFLVCAGFLVLRLSKAYYSDSSFDWPAFRADFIDIMRDLAPFLALAIALGIGAVIFLVLPSLLMDGAVALAVLLGAVILVPILFIYSRTAVPKKHEDPAGEALPGTTIPTPPPSASITPPVVPPAAPKPFDPVPAPPKNSPTIPVPPTPASASAPVALAASPKPIDPVPVVQKTPPPRKGPWRRPVFKYAACLLVLALVFCGGYGLGSSREEGGGDTQRGAHSISSASGPWVYISRTGTKYHRTSSCSNMNDPIFTTLDEALSLGYTRCSKCW